jgi:hypothetical protein
MIAAARATPDASLEIGDWELEVGDWRLEIGETPGMTNGK